MINHPMDYFIGNKRYMGELIYDGALDNTRKVIIVYSAMEGRGSFSLSYARDLALCGFVVFVADLYGDGLVLTEIDKMISLVMPLVENRADVRQRALAAYETVVALPWVNEELVGAIGFCLGGMCVLEIARSGSKLKAGVSIHGALAKSTLPTEAIVTKLLIIAGYQDPLVPSSNALVDFTNEMLDAKNNDWVFTFFGNAKHSFSDKLTGSYDPDRETKMGREYNEIAAKLSFKNAVAFFDQVLN